jgi:cytochrome c5
LLKDLASVDNVQRSSKLDVNQSFKSEHWLPSDKAATAAALKKQVLKTSINRVVKVRLILAAKWHLVAIGELFSRFQVYLQNRPLKTGLSASFLLKSPLAWSVAFALSTTTLSGCVMSEEMKRIDAQNKAQLARDESGSTNLTGEQIFVRNCNTCHMQGRAGFGPSLENFAKDFPTDAALKAFLRKGKGMMPPQDKLTDQEMDNLVAYLHTLTFEK